MAIPPSFHSFSFIVVCIHVMIAKSSTLVWSQKGMISGATHTSFHQMPSPLGKVPPVRTLGAEEAVPR